MATRVRLCLRCSGRGWCTQHPGLLSPVPPAQAYVEKYKFTSVVAQDLLDSFLSFFPELKEQSVDCRAGEAHCLPRVQGQMALSPPGEQWV